MNNQYMQAVVITRFGEPDVLELRTVPKPQPQQTEVLVRVRASALNRADLLQRRGHYPAPAGSPADIPGMEFAGEIAMVGSLVQLWKPGQRVMGLIGGGAHAEYVAVHERTLVEVPAGLNLEQAAAIPEAFITVHDALWVQAGLRPSERVLIHAVGSGVGIAAVQLTRAMNAVCIGTSRTGNKLSRAQEFGLGSGFVLSHSPTAEDAQRWAANGGFDVVLDLAGGAYTGASLHALRSRGRIMVLGTMAGQKTELELGLLLSKRVRITGTVLRARPLEEKITLTRTFANEVVPLFATGVLKPVIDSEFTLADIRRAHERMESNESFGKIIVRMDH